VLDAQAAVLNHQSALFGDLRRAAHLEDLDGAVEVSAAAAVVQQTAAPGMVELTRSAGSVPPPAAPGEGRAGRSARSGPGFLMARGIGENPSRSPAAQIAQIEFPATRAEIVESAEDNDAPVEVINFLKSLPKERYGSQEEVLRDFAEAELRFASGNAGSRVHRENIGRAAAEGAKGPRHP